MMAENDGVDEEIRAALQVAVTVAARMGEQASRAREQRSREAQANSTQHARQDEARLTAERDAARASLAPVHHSEWWDAAQTHDIAKAYETARAWADVDPEAARAQERIVTELRDRFGVDAGEGTVRDALGRAEQERTKGREDEQEAAALMLAADQSDHLAEDAADRAELTTATGAPEASASAEPEQSREEVLAEGAETAGATAYDSTDRREKLAHHLEATVDNKAAIEARLRADTSQARPPGDATAHTATKSPKARRTRTAAAGRQAQRGGRAR